MLKQEKQIDILNMSNEQVEGLVNKMKDIIDPVQKLSFLISDNEQLCNLLWDIYKGLICFSCFNITAPFILFLLYSNYNRKLK